METENGVAYEKIKVEADAEEGGSAPGAFEPSENAIPSAPSQNVQVKFENATEPDQIESALELINGHPADEPAINEIKNVEDEHVHKKTCRLCAQPIAGKEIFLYDNQELQQKINCILPIATELGDGLPEHICSACEGNVKQFYGFVCKVVDADKTNRTRLKPSPEAISDDVSNTIKEIFGADPNDSEGEDENGLDNHAHIEAEKPVNANNFQEKQGVKRPLETFGQKLSKLGKMQEMKCSHCPATFGTYFALINHTKATHKKQQYACPEPNCKSLFDKEKSLRDHVKSTHNVPVICVSCGKIFASDTALSKHIENKHFFKICDKCGMTFQLQGSYKKHQLLHAEADDLQCVYCHKIFNFKRALHRHTRQLHTGNFMLLIDGEEDKAF